MNDILLVKYRDLYGKLCYGLVTNESYPHVKGFNDNLAAAKLAISHGVAFVNTLGVTASLHSLIEFEEVDYE